MTSYVFRDS